MLLQVLTPRLESSDIYRMLLDAPLLFKVLWKTENRWVPFGATEAQKDRVVTPKDIIRLSGIIYQIHGL